MDDTVIIHSFGFNDRSGKVRWLALELGLPVENVSVELGANRQFPYRDLNPYGVIPAVEWRGETLIESTAICTYIAEYFPDAGFVVAPGEPDRAAYLRWLSICSDSLETKLVEYYLAGAGLYPKEYQAINEKTLTFKLRVLLEQMPDTPYLVANRLTLADITLAYCLRLAVASGLLKFEQVSAYLTPLTKRNAAVESQFFGSLKKHLEAQ